RRKLDHADDATARQLLGRIAEIHEVMLEESEEAIAAHLEILDRDPTDRAAPDELAARHRGAGRHRGPSARGARDELARRSRDPARHADLLDVLERQAQLDTRPVARTERHVEI